MSSRRCSSPGDGRLAHAAPTGGGAEHPGDTRSATASALARGWRFVCGGWPRSSARLDSRSWRPCCSVRPTQTLAGRGKMPIPVGFDSSAKGSHMRFRALLLDVKGFQQWGAARTESGAVTFTSCETAEACTETVTIAANFMAETFADKHYPSPTVISGELIYSVTAGKPDAQPAVALNIFSDPPPAQLKERATARRDTLLARPGFRSTFAIGPTNLGGGATLLVADDKLRSRQSVRASASTSRRSTPRRCPRLHPKPSSARLSHASWPNTSPRSCSNLCWAGTSNSYTLTSVRGSQLNRCTRINASATCRSSNQTAPFNASRA